MKQITNDNKTCLMTMTVNEEIILEDSRTCASPMTNLKIYLAGSYSDQWGTEDGSVRNFKFSN